MKLKVLICDDDITFINKLENDILIYFNNVNQEVIIEKRSKNFLSTYFDEYNIIFMDINLSSDNIDGISLSAQLKKSNPNMLIIFTSSRNELVFKTFKVGGFQFIRKNHYQYDFEETMQQISDYILKNMSFVLLNINGRMKKIYIKKIKYIVSIGHEIIIHCYDTEFIFRSTMKQLLKTLEFNHLIQIQKNFAVNLEYVNDFIKWKVICDDGEFIIGRKYQKDFQQSYERYLLHHNGRI